MRRCLRSFSSLPSAFVLAVAGTLVLAGSPQAEPLAPAAINLSATYTQNFDTLATSGITNVWTDDSTIPGWYATRTTYNAGNGSSNTGAMYSYGTGTSTDRALGSVASNTTGPIEYGARFVNNTGSAITSLQVSYTGEQWRDAGAGIPNSQKLDFSYLTGNTVTSLTAGGYIDVDSLDFASPTFTNTGAGTALDGNLAANRTAVSGTFSVLIPVGTEIMLKWSDVDNAGNDHGLAVDDLSVTVATTAAVVTSLAVVRRGGSAVLRWRTGSEVGLARFDVYREQAGRKVRLNRNLIAAAGTPLGRRYAWNAGRVGPSGYWLQVVRRDGSRVWRGPVRVAGGRS